MKYYGEINYTIDHNHPDIEYVEDWNRDKVFAHSDMYTFDEGYDEENDVIPYIQRDLKLVAGGGYNWEHIHNVKFDIFRV